MAIPFNQSSTDVAGTRAAFGRRLGEIIESVIGDDRVKTLFDAAGKHPDEYAGQPTGDIALKLGVITPETKTALLVAQAAERTWQLADKTGEMAAHHTALTDGKVNLAAAASGYVSETDPVFEFVGSPRDSEILQRAQGTWMAAQLLLNAEIEAVNKRIPSPILPGSETGLKQAAAVLFAEASQMLAAQGHTQASEKLEAVFDNLAAQLPDESRAPTPSRLMDYLLAHNLRLDRAAADFANPVDPQPVYKHYERLAELTKTPAERAAAAIGNNPKPAVS